jgi:hypothetical protein
MESRYLHFILTFLFFQFGLAARAQTAEKFLGYSDYQIITDRNFKADRYFERLAEHGVNFQRIWVLGYSHSAKEVDELMPFVKKGSRYRLSEINPQYLARLENVLKAAEHHNLRVMLTLFDHWSLSRVFRQTPWHPRNNHERLLQDPLPSFYSLDKPQLQRVQKNLVKQIVRQSKRFHPVYEIMNEAAGANCKELAGWHDQVASWILEEFPEAEIGVNLKPECGEVLNADWVDIISFHQNIWEKNGICPSIQKYPEKHVIIDTDGAWEVRDDNSLVQTWLDEALRCGGSFNHKDNIYELDREFLQLYKNRTGHVSERGGGAFAQ